MIKPPDQKPDLRTIATALAIIGTLGAWLWTLGSKVSEMEFHVQDQVIHIERDQLENFGALKLRIEMLEKTLTDHEERIRSQESK